MDLKQLHYFVTVVEEGTISAAAKKLFLSQPPLSAQMKLLEEELGCVLFQRGQRHIQLTEAGKQLYKKATVLLELSRVAKEEMREYTDAQVSTVRVGIVSSVVGPMATRWIADFTALHPEVIFSIYESDTYDLIEKLHNNILHIAVVRTPYAADDLAATPLKTEPIVAMGRPVFFPGEEHPIPLSTLSHLPLILYRRWEAVIKGEFDKLGLPLHLKCICDSANTVVDLLEEGIGVGLAPASATRLISDPGVVCRQLEDCRIESRIDLIRQRDVYVPPCVREFCEYLGKLYLHGDNGK